jgi:hypothetical protein
MNSKFLILKYSNLYAECNHWQKGILRRLEWQLLADVSGQTIDSIFKDQAVQNDLKFLDL